MSELVWQRPWLVPAAVLAAVLVYALVAWLGAAGRRIERYGAACTEGAARPRARALRWAGIGLLLGLAAAEPLLGEQRLEVERRGLDVLFCLDVSRSMLARDVAPDRLTRAKQDVLSLLPALVGGDRAGLVAFAGEARLAVPLTHDLDSFRQLLGLIDTDSVRRGGTDIAGALREALRALEKGSERTSTIVLLTDGEDLAGAGRQAAGEARDRGILVHAIGYGSSQGSKIVYRDPQRGEETFLKSNQGDDVVSTLDADGLRALAAAAGGEFLRADAVALPLQELHSKRLALQEKRGYEAGVERSRQSRFQWPLVPAFVLLLAELYCRGGRRRC